MNRTLVVVTLALALVATACGDDSDGKLSGAATPGGLSTTTLPLQSGPPGYLPGRYELSLVQGFNSTVRGNAGIGYLDSMTVGSTVLAKDQRVTTSNGTTRNEVGVLSRYAWTQKRGTDPIWIAMRVSEANYTLLKSATVVKFQLLLQTKGASYFSLFPDVGKSLPGRVKYLTRLSETSPAGVPAATVQVEFRIFPEPPGEYLVVSNGASKKLFFGS